jgi:hypothetical protein
MTYAPDENEASPIPNNLIHNPSNAATRIIPNTLNPQQPATRLP